MHRMCVIKMKKKKFLDALYHFTIFQEIKYSYIKPVLSKFPGMQGLENNNWNILDP